MKTYKIETTIMNDVPVYIKADKPHFSGSLICFKKDDEIVYAINNHLFKSYEVVAND